MTGDALAQAGEVIRAAHAELVARMAGDGTGPDGPLLPVIVMVDTTDLRLCSWLAGMRQQLDDLCRPGRHERIIVHVAEDVP
jgi:hypothetical protein